MRRILITILSALLMGVVGNPVIGMAYEEIEVHNGGTTITGRVTFKGHIPENRAFPAVLYPFGPFCQKNHEISDGKGNILLKDVEVGTNQGLKDVIVAVEGVTRGKPFKPIVANILTRDCEFLPFVNVVQDRGTFIIKNEDPVLHNSQLYQAEKGNVILNVPIPPHSTREHAIRFEKNKRIYQMICGMHEFMQTWGFAVDNPYYALTGADGKFTIDELPPGTYKIIAWHPHFKSIEQEVRIQANTEVSLNFVFDRSKSERAIYETQDRFRVGP